MKKSISYNFDVDDAVKYGVDEAIILSNIRYWVFTNQAKNHNFKLGKYWTYNSAEALTRLYPFWTRRKIARLLQRLEASGAIISSKDTEGGDQTKWYTTNDNKPLVNSDQRALDNSDQPLVNSDQSVYKQLKNTIVKQRGEPIKESEINQIDGFNKHLSENPAFAIAWSDWIEYRKARRKPMSVHASNRLKKTLNKHTVQECIEAIDTSIQSDWSGLFPKTRSMGKQSEIKPGENIDKLI